VLAIAGEPNDAVRELWSTTVRRSFDAIDGNARVRSLWEQMVPVVHEGRDRRKVYPAEDERVMRVVRKIIRGLCHHHGLGSPVPDEAVFADVLKYQVPPNLIEYLPYEHREQDIFSYRFDGARGVGYESAWLLTFYERTTFVGLICRSTEAIHG
jgi:hypothetical protein